MRMFFHLNRNRIWQPGLLRLAVILGGALLLLGSAGVAHAATIVVNSTADTVAVDSACTPREAIINANNDNQSGSIDCTAGSGADTITFALPPGPQTITLTGGQLDLTSNLTIDGGGVITVSGSTNSRIFNVNSGGVVTLIGLTIRDGRVVAGNGGGILNAGGSVTLSSSTVVSNTATSGGGIYNTSSGSVTLSASSVVSNSVTNYGGGIYNSGSVISMTGSTISFNRAISTTSVGLGGGVYHGAGVMTITDSTVASNTASSEGGGFFSTAMLTLDSTTVRGNAGAAGGIRNSGSGRLTLNNSQIISNMNTFAGSYGGGLDSASTSHNTINTSVFAGNTSGAAGAIYAEGVYTITNSVIRDNSGGGGVGGIRVISGAMTITNTTISGNSGTTAGGLRAASNVNLNNTIIANSVGGVDCSRTSGTLNAQNSLIEGGLTCVNGTNLNNLTGDPALNADLTLSSGSKAINAGDNALLPGDITTDLAGNARIQQSTVDMGAYESPFAAPVAGVCFAEYTGDNTTDFASADAQAVRDAVAAAGAGGVVKIAGVCAGAVLESGTTQVARIAKALTLAGGYTTTNWTTSDPVANPTTLDALAGGRVIYATAAATVQDLAVQNGSTAATSASGAGIYATQPFTLSNVTLYNNVTTGSNAHGAGAFFASTAMITGTTFISNRTELGYGGGLYVSGLLRLENSLITLNTGATPGGVQAFGTAYITNTAFVNNTATGSYGGGADFQGATTITGSRFEGNRASTTGGGASFATAAQVSDSVFVNNSGTSGAGVILGGSGGQRRLVNVLFDRNTPTINNGAVILIGSSDVELVHTTVVSPTLVASRRAVGISDGTLVMTNMIIANHAVGLFGSGGAASEDYNLFDTVTTPHSGSVIAGANSITGTAAFVDPANGDYRLTADSQAIDLGTNAGVTTDYFGNGRPQGLAPDAGFHEFSYTATACGVTNGGSYTLGAKAVTIEVVDKGDIDCLTVAFQSGDHPNATVGIQTGQYWQISATDSGATPVTSGFNVTLIVPVSFTPDANDKVCRYTGAGAVWDCAASSFDASNKTITRAGVNQFSAWAAGAEVGANAVALSSFAAEPNLRGFGVLAGLFAALLALLSGAWLWRRHTTQPGRD